MGYKKIEKKVFSANDMPRDVQNAFEDIISNLHYRIGNYYETYVYSECYNGTEDYVKVKDGEVLWRGSEETEDAEMVLIRGNDIVSDWMLDNGGELWEEVLIER